MLNLRQREIINYLCKNNEEFINASFFASRLNVSLRTIQNDFTSIKKELNKHKNILSIETQIPNGTRIVVHNSEKLDNLLSTLSIEYSSSLNYKDNRISSLLNFLISCKKPISIENLSNSMYVSTSTLNKDLKELSMMISKYNLLLQQKKGQILVEGKEIDKRRCIIKNGTVFLKVVPNESDINNAFDEDEFIRKVLVNQFVENRFKIIDSDFQNLIVWLKISLMRMTNGFYINDDDEMFSQESISDAEILIATRIYEKLSSSYNIKLTKNEILFLSTYLSNHSTYIDIENIYPEVNIFIENALDSIEDFFPVKFKDNINLKISLAVHTSPLISRAKNNMLISNKMKDYVKQNFSFAYDIATYYVYLLSNEFSIVITEDEIAFVAILFNRFLYENQQIKDKKRICIISSQVRSSIFLVEQLLFNKFHKSILNISYLTPDELNDCNLNNYDTFFSTENNDAVASGLASLISAFPDEKELDRIGEIINGHINLDNIVTYFNPNLFFISDLNNKSEIENLLIKKAEELYNLQNLKHEIDLRNQYGSTYFGNGVAILHPMRNISDSSFIGICKLKNPIVWDDDQSRVKLILLICLDKNNQASFETWDLISPIIFDSKFAEEMDNINEYEDFIKCFTKAVKNGGKE